MNAHETYSRTFHEIKLKLACYYVLHFRVKKGSVSPGFCVSFRVPLTRDFVTIYSKWRARLQAKLWRGYSVRNSRETCVTLK